VILVRRERGGVCWTCSGKANQISWLMLTGSGNRISGLLNGDEYPVFVSRRVGYGLPPLAGDPVLVQLVEHVPGQ